MAASGSDDVLGATKQTRKALQGKDFTSLLGFDTLLLPSSTSTRSGIEEEQKNKHHAPTPANILGKDVPPFEPSIVQKNDHCPVNNHCLTMRQNLPSTDQKPQSSLSHIFQDSSNIQLEQVSDTNKNSFIPLLSFQFFIFIGT